MNARLLTARQVADELGINEQHVRKLTRAGELAGINITTGRVPRWRYEPKAVASYKANRTTVAA